ncbi:hypothetical protein HK098_004414 [Nowakowskiella sp. JEL0407]|nr:hypothetical protein HK098_004414 [Nowakowskiella sp. JEL0407]
MISSLLYLFRRTSTKDLKEEIASIDVSSSSSTYPSNLIPPQDTPSNSNPTESTSSNFDSQNSQPQNVNYIPPEYEVEVEDDTDQQIEKDHLLFENQPPFLYYESIARAISYVATTARISLRAAGMVADTALETAKVGTSMSLGLGRSLLVNALYTARSLHLGPSKRSILDSDVSEIEEGSDVAQPLPEHVSLFHHALDRYTSISIGVINNTFSLAELFTLATFHLTTKTVKFSFKAAEETVRVFDGLFGSTETSRALAALVSMVRQELIELNNGQGVLPGRGFFGTTFATIATLGGLTKSLTAYACLQLMTVKKKHETLRLTMLYEGMVAVDSATATTSSSWRNTLLAGMDSIDNDVDDKDVTIKWASDPSERDEDLKIYTPVEIAESPRIITSLDTVKLVDTPLISPSPGTSYRSDLKRTATVSSRSDAKSFDSRSFIEEASELRKNIQTIDDAKSLIDEADALPINVDGILGTEEPTRFSILEPDDEGLLMNPKSQSIQSEIFLDRMSKDFSDTYSEIAREAVYKAATISSQKRPLGHSRSISISSKSSISSLSEQRTMSLGSSGRVKSASDLPNLSKLSLTSIGSGEVIEETSCEVEVMSATTVPLSPAVSLSASRSARVLMVDELRKLGDVKSPSLRQSLYQESRSSESTVQVVNPADADGKEHTIGRSSSTKSLTGSKTTLHTVSQFKQQGNETHSTTTTAKIEMTTTAAATSTAADDPAPGPSRGDSFTSPSDLTIYQHYPNLSLLNNFNRYVRFASGSYGRHFMNVFNIGRVREIYTNDPLHHPNHYAFHMHTGISIDCIVSSSYTVGAEVGYSAGRSTEDHEEYVDEHEEQNKITTTSTSQTGASDDGPHGILMGSPKLKPLIHYIVLDHERKCVVLTLRGTLGLSDLLHDGMVNFAFGDFISKLTGFIGFYFILALFKYVEFEVPSESRSKKERLAQPHFAHGGMVRLARKIAEKNPSNVIFACVKKYLTDLPDYGLILCGHSLGGGVASLLAILWSTQTSKFTSTPSQTSHVTSSESGLPPNRPIHCYSFGSPSCVSHHLANGYSRGLVSSIINGDDLFPSLSLGLVRDLKTVSTHLLDPEHKGISEKIIGKALNRSWSRRSGVKEGEIGDDEFFWNIVLELRKNMVADKLYPPGVVYWIQSSKTSITVKSTDSSSLNQSSSSLSSWIFGSSAYNDVAPTKQESRTEEATTSNAIVPTENVTAATSESVTTRIKLHRCEDVRDLFSELRFSPSMLSDHTPKAYEDSLDLLYTAVSKKGRTISK